MVWMLGFSCDINIDGLVQEGRTSSALAMELSFFHQPIDIKTRVRFALW